MSLNPLHIRKFNDSGIDAFREYLNLVKRGERLDAPEELVSNLKLTERVRPDTLIEPLQFNTSLEMVQYLHPRIVNLALKDKFYNVGLWAWLAAYYFDVICPIEKGKRRVGDEVRYIPARKTIWRRVSRHLIAAPVRFFDAYPEHNLLMLYSHSSKQSSFFSRVSESQELSMSHGVIEALHLLYWDETHGVPKKGALVDDSPGTLRRFVAVINQLSLTFDLQGMTGEQIISLLPTREFSRWLK